MNISDLELMTAIASDGTLTESARSLGITPAAVSRRLQALEQELNTELAIRNTRSLTLTKQGEMLVSGSRDILRRMTALKDSVSSISRHYSGQLRVNCSYGYGTAIVAPALRLFQSLYPDILVSLMLSDRPLDLVHDGFDLGITVGRVPAERYRAKLLFENRKSLVASPKYLATLEKKPTHLSELSHLHCIDIIEDFSTAKTWSLTNGKEDVSVKIDPILTTNSSVVATHWAVDGTGIILRSRWAIRKELENGTLIEILPEWHVDNNAYMYYADRKKSAAVSAFIHFFTEYIGHTKK